MKISVCMGIYNGERFIEKQLASIMKQTYSADEIILCDDGSTDATILVVNQFIEKYRLETSWHLYQNHEHKGYPQNFYDAMNLCTGDIVFLADQDDIWAETKLEKMISALNRHPEVSVLACSFGLIDGNGNEIRPIMKPSHGVRNNELKAIKIHDIFYRYEWPGMVLAYRNAWYQKWDKTIGKIPHDIFLCSRAAEEHTFFQLGDILAWHRRHGNNTAEEEHRIRKLLNKERKLWEIEKYLKMLEQFERCKVLRTEEGCRILQEKLAAMYSRYEALKSGKIIHVLKSAMGNRRNVRVATVICDLLIAKF